MNKQLLNGKYLREVAQPIILSSSDGLIVD